MTHSALKDSPLHVLWDPKTLLWVILAAEAIAVVLSLAPGLDTSWIDFGITSFAIQWAVLLTLGGLYLMRHRLAKARPLTIANLALLFLFIAATTVIAAAIAVVGNAWSMGIKQWMGLLLRIYGITVTVGLLGIMAFRSHWLARQFAVKAKQFELDALQARIQPHFLFNTLNTGAALVRLHPAKAEQLLMDLAELFRANLGGPERVNLGEELTLVKRYLEIEQMRLGDRLHVDWRVPASIPDLTVPSLSIQPLVENAIRHGVEPRLEASIVVIELRNGPETVIVEIRNPLPPKGQAARTGHQVGLAAVRARLQQTDSRIQLQTERGDDEFVATVEIRSTTTLKNSDS
ncbi:hypothetical protein LMG31886_16750 [Xanthomonas hydrangeae]|uniref:sensor histidine kinase n=1 Tax=Xanthomonas hydrangeae TaxID=2775159 RepID=UPI0019639BAF|nr:hypothetical protein LMG31884_17740 [Xanthomonas hydrangeae]CAD7715711.1 hypothetical protein LMG31884_17740 [Xanthomonas hydrangeae]CAD7728865.1 hypothetical protein LMG31887_17730 [Xanthomonas hydrangeae]CAD7728869.1 hypothetical protein LMG31887_17730 [Xanthomonas hydrangeae]CAD7732137.1 hypothetical protein LMG31886_16750 [Xanthomonas hydrangeae]